MTGVAPTIVDYLAELGLEVANNHFKEKIDEKKLRSALQAYIVRQKSIMKYALFPKNLIISDC